MGRGGGGSSVLSGGLRHPAIPVAAVGLGVAGVERKGKQAAGGGSVCLVGGRAVAELGPSGPGPSCVPVPVPTHARELGLGGLSSHATQVVGVALVLPT